MSSLYLSARLAAPPLQEGGVTWWVILLWVIAIILAIVFWQWWKFIEEEAEATNVREREMKLAGTVKSELVQEVQATVRPPSPEQVDEAYLPEEEDAETAPATATPDAAGAMAVDEETAVAAAPPEPDDLTKIEGVGPKIKGLLNDAGLLTFAQLSQAEPDHLKQILADAGARYKLAEPATWPRQAALAAEGKWEELETLQEELKGGREA